MFAELAAGLEWVPLGEEIPRTGWQPAGRFEDAAFPAGPKAIDGGKSGAELADKGGQPPRCRCGLAAKEARSSAARRGGPERITRAQP